MGRDRRARHEQPHEIELFWHNGFVKLPTQLRSEPVEGLKEAALADFRNDVEPLSEKDGQPTRLSNGWGRGGVFRKTIECDEILDPVESPLEPNIEFQLNLHNHIYLQNAASTASLELHRDCRQWARSMLAVLIFREETNLENGCTRLVPGSHRLPILWDIMDIRSRKDLLESVWHQPIPIPMPAGGMLAMNGLVLHAAGVNRTDRTRMSMTLGYHSYDEKAAPGENSKLVLLRGELIFRGNDRGKKRERLMIS